MHTGAMGLEIVVSRPQLALFATVSCSAFETPVAAVMRYDSMKTFLMTVEVVLGCKAFFSRAAVDVTLMRPLMPLEMLPTTDVRFEGPFVGHRKRTLAQICS